MKTFKDLRSKLVSKKAGSEYVYRINNTRYEICEFNCNKGWCLNEYREHERYGEELVDSYGYEGLLLKDCKEMILLAWNNNEIA